jgi:hypothetical protein
VADGDKPQVKPAAWWGTILAAAREKATTAQVWGAIRDYADQAGLAIPSNLFAEVNRMRSMASGLRVSSERLDRARPSDAITASMIGSQVYQRSPTERTLAPLYHVRFEMVSSQAGTTSRDWYTLEYSGALPGTVGSLMDDVLDYALGLSAGYGVEFREVGSIEVGEW